MDEVKKPSDISKENIARLGQDETVLLEMLDKDVKAAEITLDPWKQRIVKYYELYKLYQDKKHYDGLATIFVPEILRAVETVVGNLYKAITSNNPWFQYEGRTADEDASAAALTQLTLYEMDENGFKHRLMDSLRQMATTGLTVRKVLWDFTQVARTRKNYVESGSNVDEKTGKPVSFKAWQKETFLDTVKDHWTFEPVDLLSLLLPDISVPYNDMQKSRWIAEQYVVDMQWVRERAKKGWLVEVEKRDLFEDRDEPFASRARTLRDNRMRTSGFTVKTQKPEGIEIIERWGLLPAHYVYTAEQLAENGLESDDEIETILIVANRRKILKLEANPFWHNQKPYLFCPYVPQEFEFDGIGVGQIGEKLQEELNDTRNQTMDNKTLVLMCMWLKSRSSGIKNADLRVRPLGVIATNDMKGLAALRPPVLSGVGVNIEGTIKNDLRESVGAPSNLQGIAQAGVGTATEASEVNASAMGRLMLTSQLYGELVLKPLLIMAEYLNYQFYDHTKTIRIVGPTGINFRKLTPEMLIGNKDVILDIPTDLGASPAAKRQQYMQFLTILQTMQPQQIEYHWKLLDRIYKESFGGRGLAELYDAPPEDVDILDTQDEVDLILADYPLLPQKRTDAKQHALELEQEYHKYKWVLSPQQHEIFKALVLGYEKMAMDQLQAQQAQLQMVMAAQNGGQAGPGTMAAQTPGTSASTQPAGPIPPSPAQNQGVA
jgi:hypothetical protein